ncbi:hypothetical protein SUNI508_05098 [Seiridium unicorne]
MGSWR